MHLYTFTSPVETVILWLTISTTKQIIASHLSILVVPTHITDFVVGAIDTNFNLSNVCPHSMVSILSLLFRMSDHTSFIAHYMIMKFWFLFQEVYSTTVEPHLTNTRQRWINTYDIMTVSCESSGRFSLLVEVNPLNIADTLADIVLDNGHI